MKRMEASFDILADAKAFAKMVNGTYSKNDNGQWTVVWDKEDPDLRHFIRACLADDEFWLRGGIPQKEKHYIEKLNLSEEQVHEFYEAMCSLQHLSKEVARQ